MTTPTTSRSAVWSVVLGTLAVLSLGPITGIPAVICGHISRKRIRVSQGTLTGDGMALAGIIMGYIGIVTVVVSLLAFSIMGETIRSRIQKDVEQLGRETPMRHSPSDLQPLTPLSELPETR